MTAPSPASGPGGEPGPLTLAVDSGGTGIKACVLDAQGAMVSQRLRVLTPYPCPPEVYVATVLSLAEELQGADRASVGMPGLVRHGVVHATPHYVTESGPFSPRRPDLVEAWARFDAQAALAEALGVPARVVNDAEMAGLAVIEGRGYEVVLTLGTGLGFAQFDGGVLLPKLELSQHLSQRRATYDERLGNRARRRVGDERWSRRVAAAVEALWPVLWWDHLHLGGGNARRLRPHQVQRMRAHGPVNVVHNNAGLHGGVRLWSLPDPAAGRDLRGPTPG
ncbi:ROK family protein [Vallicoccus soli]|uniref:ROK family protein n=1 Tax=Vallicoccus soli TaxID=2339232 RepID=A0A3A3Z903_9ACTN|nr:ROK family protein [Vallicoccus soli]RJK97546.1 ROK family protein [Vallicoccus soli]